MSKLQTEIKQQELRLKKLKLKKNAAEQVKARATVTKLFDVFDNNTTKLAEALRVSRGTIYNWLSGKTQISSNAHKDIIIKLAKKYEIKI